MTTAGPGYRFGRFELGDEAGQPTYIATVPRRGYRFVAALEAIPAAAPVPATPSRRRIGPWVWTAAGHGQERYARVLERVGLRQASS